MKRLDVLRTATREEVSQLTDEELRIFQREFHMREMKRRRLKRKELKNNANAKKCNN